MPIERINTEAIIRREENHRRAVHAGERGVRVHTSIQQQSEDLAKKYGISVEQLNTLLSDPTKWFNFLKSKTPTNQNTEQAVEQPDGSNPWFYVANNYEPSTKWRKRK